MSWSHKLRKNVSMILKQLVNGLWNFSVSISDANGETVTREIIIGIVTQRDLLNYIMHSEGNGNGHSEDI